MSPASRCKDVLQERKQVSIIHDEGEQKAYLDDTAEDLNNGDAALPQRIQDDCKRRTEAPDDPDDDPCGESMHAENGTRKEERERDQNKHDNSLVGVKLSESVPVQGEITY